MVLSPVGNIVDGFWREIPNHFSNVILDEYVIMPNHIHGIININNERKMKNDRPVNNIGYRDRACRSVALQRPYKHRSDDHHCIQIPHKNEYMSRISPKPKSLSTIIRSFKSICTRTINKKHPEIRFAWQPRIYDHIIRNEAFHTQKQLYILNNPRNWDKDKNHQDHFFHYSFTHFGSPFTLTDLHLYDFNTITI